MALRRDQQKHIAAWQSSGLSQVQYCCEHKLNSKTFTNWLRVYRLQQRTPAAPTLIPVEVTSEAPSPVFLCLRWPQGHTLELPADVSPKWLGELLKCLD